MGFCRKSTCSQQVTLDSVSFLSSAILMRVSGTKDTHTIPRRQRWRQKDAQPPLSPDKDAKEEKVSDATRCDGYYKIKSINKLYNVQFFLKRSSSILPSVRCWWLCFCTKVEGTSGQRVSFNCCFLYINAISTMFSRSFGSGLPLPRFRSPAQDADIFKA